MDVAESLSPTLIIITDIFYNDIGAAIFHSDNFHPEEITPIEDYEISLERLFLRLKVAGAYVFVTNMPRISNLPMVKTLINKFMKNGTKLEDISEKLNEIEDMIMLFNLKLENVIKSSDKFHLVDMRKKVEEIAVNGMDIGGKEVRITKFGGFLSLDGLHFSDTGYAVLANLFIERFNEVFSMNLPLIDLEKVMDADPFSPDNLKKEGFDISLCKE